MKFSLQLFAEKNLQNQTSVQLRKGIRSFQKEIELHIAKIANPKDFCLDWDSKDERGKFGLIRHWQHEIRIFERSIQNRIDELTKRGEQP